MNWKLFITACVSTCIISFPQNIIGCGPDADPYDYYTSFFHPYLPDAPDYKPFYYTGYNFLYDNNEPQDVAALLTDEWVKYCKGKVSQKDAFVFMNKFSVKDIDALYKKVDKNIVKKLADTLTKNSMTKYLLETKDKEALGYILHAKQVEPYVVGGADYWEAPKRDSVKMDRLIKNGKTLYKATQSDFIKLRIGYQMMRLMHYSNRYAEAIAAYDNYVATNPTPSVLQPLSLALKAGAQFRSGHPKEAAYNFSKAFAGSGAKRVSNYLGFIWSITSTRDRNDYLQYCKNDKEKADMLSLFAMSSIGNELPTMEEIVKLHPASPALEVLVVREINKLEEKYFTPLLRNEEGGRSIYASWLYDGTDTMIAGGREKTIALANFLIHTTDKNVTNKALFATGSAYCYYMAQQYSEAEAALKKARDLNPSGKIKDQIELTNILITLSRQKNIDEKFESQLLPSLQWLLSKTKQPGSNLDGWDINYWRNFYRNLMNDIVARKYYQQGNIARQIMAAGSADKVNNSYYYESTAIDLMRKIATKDAMALYDIYNSKQPSAFEKFIIKNNTIDKSEVIDYIGTSYIRDYDFDKAIPWLQRSPDKGLTKINKNPFIELMYDREAPLRSERKFSTNKLNFAIQMAALKKKITTNKATAKEVYQYATALYNITYYGHTWEMVEYFRSSSGGYYIPEKASDFEKEYYGCNSAHDFFEKAMNMATDRNFKAKCLFMMAKCSQKQLDRPKYEDYYNKEYSAYDSAEQKYFDRFMNNIYFPRLVKDYSSTSFYKEAYNTCSYLRDFVKRKK